MVECRITAIEEIHRGLTILKNQIANIVDGIGQRRRTCRTMDGAQLRAISRIDVFNLVMLEVIDAPRVAEVIILNQVYVTVEVTLQRSIGIVVVFGVIGVTIVEVRGTRIGQVLLCIVLDGLQLVAVAHLVRVREKAGDDEAVNHHMPPLHSFAMVCHRGMACHLSDIADGLV